MPTLRLLMTDIVLAHDGSTHCGWVGRYAVHLAQNSGGRLLCLHIDEETDDKGVLDEGIGHLLDIAARAGVPASCVHEPCARGVAETITAFMRTLPGALLVLGLRAREDGRGLLAGTISETLLDHADHDVLAIRVTAPGLLGDAKHILYALSQNPNSARKGRQLLRLFAPRRVSLLTVVQPVLGHLANPTTADMKRLWSIGSTFLSGVHEQLRETLPETILETTVRVAADWTGETLRHASRVDAHLLLVGATERSLPRRLVFGTPLERLLHDAACDVAVFRLGKGRDR